MVTCPFLEHINLSCTKNHSEMRNVFRALAGCTEYHWTLGYKLRISCSADMHLMKEAAFVIFLCARRPSFPPQLCGCGVTAVRGLRIIAGRGLINATWWISLAYRGRTISSETEGEPRERYLPPVSGSAKGCRSRLSVSRIPPEKKNKGRPPNTLQTTQYNITVRGQPCRNQTDWFCTSDWVYTQKHWRARTPVCALCHPNY